MNKREFLALGGAVPLMLAGCGGSGSGSAPVRLVNASVGYPGPLGFMDESTQITSGITYGNASNYFNIEAGSVHLTLTTTVGGAETSATAAQLRTVNKDQRYSLIAYGIPDELRLALVAELNTTPDAGTASVNVLNTSADIGAVDVYLSKGKDLAVSTQIAANVAATSTSPAQSPFATDIQPGSYYVTVVGAGSVGRNVSDVRFQTPAPVAVAALQVLTVVLTPGAGGTLANAILLTQGSAGTAVTYTNTTARIRAVTSTNGQPATVTGTDVNGNAITLLATDTTPQRSPYYVVNTTTLPTVVVGSTTVTPFMYVSGVAQAAKLEAGGDYTLLVYVDGSGTPISQLIADNNTAPVSPQGVKYRLVNLAANNQGLHLSMSVNSIDVASLVPYGTASDYKEISTPQNLSALAEVFNGSNLLIQHTAQPLTLGNVFTDFVTSVDTAAGTAKDIFKSDSNN